MTERSIAERLRESAAIKRSHEWDGDAAQDDEAAHEIERLTEGIRIAVKGCGACGGQGFEYVDDGTGEDVVSEPCAGCFDLRELIGDHTNYCATVAVAPEPFSHPVPPPFEPCRLMEHCTLRKGHEGECDDLPF